MDRQPVWDVAISVLLHLGLALIVGISWLEASGPRAQPGIWLQVYLQDGREAQDDDGTAAKHSVAPTTHASPAHRIVAAAGLAGDIEPPPGVTSTAPATLPGAVSGDFSDARAPARTDSASPDNPAVPASTADAYAAEPVRSDAAHNQTPLTGVSPVIATSADSGNEPPTRVASDATERPQLPIPAPQQAMLARRVTELARGLRDADPTPVLRSWRHGGRQYTAVLTRQPAAGDMDIERVAVDITTEESGKHLHTLLQMKRLAFSHFTQLVDVWDADVQLHDDEIVGRFHSNSRIIVGYDSIVAPRFSGAVTTSATAIATGDVSGSRRIGELFHEGLQTRANRIMFPARVRPLVSDQGASGSKVRTFSGDTRITFYSDGSYGWRTRGSDLPEQREPIASVSLYLVGAPRARMLVHGTVNGNVTVYSPRLIVIEGDLVYAHDPRATSDSKDYTALVSDNDIEVAPPPVTGPGDLRIDAAVYARGRFTVTNEYVRAYATMFVYGSLTAGSVSATEPRYATKVEFDPRFERVRPPNFPMTDRYELETWNSHWEPVESGAR